MAVVSIGQILEVRHDIFGNVGPLLAPQFISSIRQTSARIVHLGFIELAVQLLEHAEFEGVQHPVVSPHQYHTAMQVGTGESEVFIA